VFGAEEDVSLGGEMASGERIPRLGWGSGERHGKNRSEKVVSKKSGQRVLRGLGRRREKWG